MEFIEEIKEKIESKEIDSVSKLVGNLKRYEKQLKELYPDLTTYKAFLKLAYNDENKQLFEHKKREPKKEKQMTKSEFTKIVYVAEPDLDQDYHCLRVVSGHNVYFKLITYQKGDTLYCNLQPDANEDVKVDGIAPIEVLTALSVLPRVKGFNM